MFRNKGRNPVVYLYLTTYILYMQQPTEPQMRRYLMKVMKTLSAGMIYLLFHMTTGIFLGWGFYDPSPTMGNWIYYVLLMGTTAAFIYYLLRLWRSDFR
ncbi:MAG: hypothetical protein ACO3BD_05435 [Chitinophagaceae bacterium]